MYGCGCRNSHSLIPSLIFKFGRMLWGIQIKKSIDTLLIYFREMKNVINRAKFHEHGLISRKQLIVLKK